jgi:hypothetical protein
MQGVAKTMPVECSEQPATHKLRALSGVRQPLLGQFTFMGRNKPAPGDRPVSFDRSEIFEVERQVRGNSEEQGAWEQPRDYSAVYSDTLSVTDDRCGCRSWRLAEHQNGGRHLDRTLPWLACFAIDADLTNS